MSIKIFYIAALFNLLIFIHAEAQPTNLFINAEFGNDLSGKWRGYYGERQYE